MSVGTQTIQPKQKLKREDARKLIETMRDRDRQMVTGVFKFYEVPGGCMKFSYKAYKDDPVEDYEMFDGVSYTIPLGVARHLNKNGWYPVHQHSVNPDGTSSMKIGQKVHRFGFYSTDFLDSEDLLPNKQHEIMTVEKV